MVVVVFFLFVCFWWFFFLRFFFFLFWYLSALLSMVRVGKSGRFRRLVFISSRLIVYRHIWDFGFCDSISMITHYWRAMVDIKFYYDLIIDVLHHMWLCGSLPLISVPISLSAISAMLSNQLFLLLRLRLTSTFPSIILLFVSCRVLWLKHYAFFPVTCYELTENEYESMVWCGKSLVRCCQIRWEGFNLCSFEFARTFLVHITYCQIKKV